MRRMNKKKGISPIVATALLVGISIVAVAFIFMWMKGFLGEAIVKEDQPIENLCQKLAFDATISGNTIYINNQGNVPIYAVNLKIETAGAVKLKFLRPVDGVIALGESDSVTLASSFEGQKTVIPIILGKGQNSGKGKIFACEGQARILSE